MPNLNEFLKKDKIEKIDSPELEKIDGLKPCSKCEGNASYAIWNPNTFILSWKCAEGHENQVKVN